MKRGWETPLNANAHLPPNQPKPLWHSRVYMSAHLHPTCMFREQQTVFGICVVHEIPKEYGASLQSPGCYISFQNTSFLKADHLPLISAFP